MPTRRSHKKSRNGCQACKLRRVKCDENDPCSECARRGTQCQFSRLRAKVRPLVELRKSDSRIAYRPRSSQASISATFQHHGLQLEHLALLHHYTTSTSGTLAFRALTRSVWEMAIPREAYGHSFLMHCLLAVSAQHLSVLYGDIKQSLHYQSVSAYHQNRALAGYWDVFSYANTAENCLALYAASGMVTVFACAPDVQAKVSATDKVVRIFRTCIGVGILFQQWRKHMLGTSLAPLVQLHTGRTDKGSDVIDLLEESLYSLEGVIRDNDCLCSSERSTYQAALTSLKMSISALRTSRSYAECLAIWPVAMPREFPGFLSCHAPIALVLLAHYAVLLYKARDVWFIGDLGGSVIEEIACLIPEEMAEFVKWPVSFCV